MVLKRIERERDELRTAWTDAERSLAQTEAIVRRGLLVLQVVTAAAAAAAAVAAVLGRGRLLSRSWNAAWLVQVGQRLAPLAANAWAVWKTNHRRPAAAVASVRR